jgi:hypothetical protein
MYILILLNNNLFNVVNKLILLDPKRTFHYVSILCNLFKNFFLYT